MCMLAVYRSVRLVLFVTAVLVATHASALDAGRGDGGAAGVPQTKEYGDLSLSLSLTLPPEGVKPPSADTKIPSTEPQIEAASQPSQKLSDIQAQIEAVEKLIETRERLRAGGATGSADTQFDFGSFTMSFMAVDPHTLILMLALIIAILLLWYVRRRSVRAARPSRYRFTETMQGETSSELPGYDSRVAHGATGQAINIDVDSGSIKQSILPPEFQALEEAEIYLRFGHDKLAEEALNQAIKLNPQNPHVYLKLLRILFSREERVAFEALARQLHELDDEAVWEQAIEMGRALDADNPLYH